jgi:hypothetical protein
MVAVIQMLLAENRSKTTPTFMSSQRTQTSGTTVTVTTPTSLTAGNLLVAVCYRNDSTSTWTFPSGWTSFVTNTGRGIGYRVVTGTESSNYIFTCSTSGSLMGTILAFDSGVLDVAGTVGANLASSVAASVTAANNNSLLLALYSSNSTGSTVATAPAGFSLIDSYTSSFPIYWDFSNSISSGATGDVTCVFSPGTARGQLLVIGPS